MLKSSPAFVDVLVASIIDLLQRGRPVHIPGLGTWKVEHGSDQGVPRDKVTFIPEAP